MDPIVYTPPQAKKEAPKQEYVLVNDVTGKPPPKRGPQVLKAYTQEKVKDSKRAQTSGPRIQGALSSQGKL